MFRKEVRNEILAIFLIAFGGLLLHLRIHTLAASAFNIAPRIVGIISIAVLPFLFNSKKTAPIGYVLNLIAIIVGTIAMADFSIDNWNEPVTVSNILLHSTLADILILWARLPIAHSILRYWKTT
jgi:uncharacterized membrane-anchored protein